MTTDSSKMETWPINKLIFNMSLPIMFSTLILTMYNIVDSIFVAQLSEDALAAVSLALPAQNIFTAIGIGTSVGASSLISRCLGEHSSKSASSAATHGIFLGVLSYIIVFIAATFLIRPFFEFQTDSQVIINYGVDYLTIVSYCSFGMFLETIYTRIMQAAGKSFSTMIIEATGAAINIILDPIMIFGYFGCPAMGIKGAAYATVIGQITAFAVALILQKKYAGHIKISFKGFKPKWKTIKQIFDVGLPTAATQFIASFSVFAINKIIIGFSSTATALLGIHYKIQSFIYMPVNAIYSGVIPILAYSYGAGNKERIFKTLKSSVTMTVIYILAAFGVIQLFPQVFLNIFNASPNMLSIGIPALRILSILFIPGSTGLVLGTIFQAVGKGMPIMILTFARTIAVQLPLAYFLSLTGSLSMVWLSFPIAEIVSFFILIYMFKTLNRDVLQKI